MDYAAWASRASAFLRSLTFLPGEIEVHDQIEEPATDDYSQDWLRSPQCSIPSELKEFLRIASKRCWLCYQWKPPAAVREKIRGLWPGRAELAGGGDL